MKNINFNMIDKAYLKLLKRIDRIIKDDNFDDNIPIEDVIKLEPKNFQIIVASQTLFEKLLSHEPYKGYELVLIIPLKPHKRKYSINKFNSFSDLTDQINSTISPSFYIFEIESEDWKLLKSKSAIIPSLSKCGVWTAFYRETRNHTDYYRRIILTNILIP